MTSKSSLRNLTYFKVAEIFLPRFLPEPLQGELLQGGLHSIWVNFCVWCEAGVRVLFFFSFPQRYPVVSAHLLKKNYSFPNEWSWQLCQKYVDHTSEGRFLDPILLPLLTSLLIPIALCPDCCNFTGDLEIRQHILQLCSFFPKIVLPLLYILLFHINFRISLSISSNWLGCIESMDQFGGNWHLSNIESPAS